MIPRHTFTRLPAAQVQELIAAYTAGAGIKELAAKYAINRTTVQAHRDRAGIDRHKRRKPRA